LKRLNLVFMGTPHFALPTLKLLHLSAHNVEAVVTQPDRRSGRGRNLCPSPVKEWSIKQGLEIFQPLKARDPLFLAWLKEKHPDLVITAAFGQILTADLLRVPAIGCINLHASYLPAYRGAAPIHRAVMEGAPYSGVSIIEMTKELDAGDIFLQERVDISPFDTAGTLHDRLAERGADLLLKTVNALAEGKAEKRVQDHRLATYARPLSREEEKLDWNLDAMELYNRIRGLNPWPGAYTVFKGKRVKVWRAALPDMNEDTAGSADPGTILSAGDDSLTVATGKGSLILLELQPAGKKAMDAASFCCGYRVDPGECLGGDA